MVKRIAVVENEKIKSQSERQHLVNICPINKKGEECIYVEDNKVKIDEILCIGCGICVNASDGVSIINLPEALTSPPIHRYGRNGFHLYGLPIPIFGKVVGVIGRNGIGKSTAVNILSGILKPNLGDEEANIDDIISYFKGTEGQAYFEKIKNNEISVSFKMQQVDQIPKLFDGTVKEFLSKVSQDEDKLKEIANELELTNILNSKVQIISGGELQRTAIAATVLKEANVYFFDEPTSFLDIKQRMKIAQFIKNLSQKKTADGQDIAVVVIEHDLIILDYLTDTIHLVYGKENVYGIMSQPKASKEGINLYLSGYLPQENIRFRDYKMVFPERLPTENYNRENLLEWTSLKKSLDSFTVTAEAGFIYRKDVIGILGENGIGKTTFVKILAEEIAADEGKVTTDKLGGITVSYKPQYIQTKSEELVITYLKTAFNKYKSTVLKPLGIDKLQFQKLSELSGGQLQRVAVAHCLSQEADVYLLDEPSAYLDIEQRLIVSKVLKDLMELTGKTAMVVDHDLLFIDYISTNLMVFDGQPSISGAAKGPFSLRDGMNMFLQDLQMTFRKDEENHRPRANKAGSQMDQKQKAENKYYYS
jgi:ATP-binding cassette subfamily E protein 1